jgi:hypothetical protein
MSLSALFLIADERYVRSACPGWMPPLDQPRTKKSINPFTGNAYEVDTRVPEELERSLREPSVEEIETGLEYRVFDQLSKTQPVAEQFTVSNDLYIIYKDTPPFLYGDVHGEVQEIKRIEPGNEGAVLEHFAHLTGRWMDEQYRRAKGLSLFIYIHA